MERGGRGSSAALSTGLTRLKPWGTPRARVHKKQGPMRPFREERDVEGTKEARDTVSDSLHFAPKYTCF